MMHLDATVGATSTEHRAGRELMQRLVVAALSMVVEGFRLGNTVGCPKSHRPAAPSLQCGREALMVHVDLTLPGELVAVTVEDEPSRGRGKPAFGGFR